MCETVLRAEGRSQQLGQGALWCREKRLVVRRSGGRDTGQDRAGGEMCSEGNTESGPRGGEEKERGGEEVRRAGEEVRGGGEEVGEP